MASKDVMITVYTILIGFVKSTEREFHFKLETHMRILEDPTQISVRQAQNARVCAIMCTSDETCCSAAFNSQFYTCTLNSKCYPKTKAFIDTVVVWKQVTNVQLWSLNPRDCGDIPPGSNSGIYRIYPSSTAVDVYCDMTSDGGGWTVIQRRQDGSVDFYRDWNQYKHGFGDVDKEHWLGMLTISETGNDNIHRLTSQADYKLRIYIEDYTSVAAVVVYNTFVVSDESDGYRIQVQSYSGTIGDSMSHHNGMQFSATDVDNDLRPSQSCVTDEKYGGWWYNSCADANLNARYGTSWDSGGGIYWLDWQSYTPLKKTIMMCKRK